MNCAHTRCHMMDKAMNVIFIRRNLLWVICVGSGMAATRVRACGVRDASDSAIWQHRVRHTWLEHFYGMALCTFYRYAPPFRVCWWMRVDVRGLRQYIKSVRKRRKTMMVGRHRIFSSETSFMCRYTFVRLIAMVVKGVRTKRPHNGRRNKRKKKRRKWHIRI